MGGSARGGFGKFHILFVIRLQNSSPRTSRSPLGFAKAGVRSNCTAATAVPESLGLAAKRARAVRGRSLRRGGRPIEADCHAAKRRYGFRRFLESFRSPVGSAARPAFGPGGTVIRETTHRLEERRGALRGVRSCQGRWKAPGRRLTQAVRVPCSEGRGRWRQVPWRRRLRPVPRSRAMHGSCVRDGSPKGRDSGLIYLLLFFLAGGSTACCENPTPLAGERRDPAHDSPLVGLEFRCLYW